MLILHCLYECSFYRHELAVLNVYFDSMSYELVQQVPAYTWIDILSKCVSFALLMICNADIVVVFSTIEKTQLLCQYYD